MAENPMLKSLREKAMKLPLTPGVYIMKNKSNEIIYIGKAKKLKKMLAKWGAGDISTLEKAVEEKILRARIYSKTEYERYEKKFQTNTCCPLAPRPHRLQRRARANSG